jgi:hypothetical protein
MVEQSSLFAVKPIITYPREAQVGKTYLMTIDLQPEEEFKWQYEEEEYPIYCTVNSDFFTSQPVGEPVVVLHRFGGSYGEAKFLLTAMRIVEDDRFKVTLVSKWGVIIETIVLSDIRVYSKSLDEDSLTNSDFEKFEPVANDQPNELEDFLEDEQNQLEAWRQEHVIPHWDENDSWNMFHDGELPPLWHKSRYRYHNRPSSYLDDLSKETQGDAQSDSDESPPIDKKSWDWLWENFPGWDE